MKAWLGLASVALGVMVAVMLLPTVAGAQSNDVRSLVQRLNQLEGELRDVERQVYRGEPAPSGRAATTAAAVSADSTGLARMTVRLNELESQFQSLTGRLEQMEFLVRTANDRLDKLVADIDFRLTAIERNMAAPTGEVVAAAGAASATPRAAPREGDDVETQTLTPRTLGTIRQQDLDAVRQAPSGNEAATGGAIVPSTATASATPSAGTAQEQYNEAYALLRKFEFEASEQAFKAFLRDYPDSELAGNAQYWLGETYYARQDYDQAARAFLAGYQNYRDSPKAPDNLLKLAMTLRAFDQSQEACAMLDKLSSEFPDANPTLKRAASRERQRAGCS